MDLSPRHVVANGHGRMQDKSFLLLKGAEVDDLIRQHERIRYRDIDDLGCPQSCHQQSLLHNIAQGTSDLNPVS